MSLFAGQWKWRWWLNFWGNWLSTLRSSQTAFNFFFNITCFVLLTNVLFHSTVPRAKIPDCSTRFGLWPWKRCCEDRDSYQNQRQDTRRAFLLNPCSRSVSVRTLGICESASWLKKKKTFWELVQVCDLSGTRTLQNILWKLLVTANKASILFGWSFVSVKELMVYFDCSRKQQNNCFRSNVPTPQNHFAFSNHVFVRRKGEKKKQSFSIFFF